MTKLVVLKLDGDLSQEVQVRLEIGEEDSRPSIEIDILFVLDCTGSMQGEINAVRDAITDFADTIASHAVRTRVGLIEFRDRVSVTRPRWRVCL